MVVKIVLTEGRVESPLSGETIGDKTVPERGKIGDVHGFAQTQNPCSLFGKKSERWEMPSEQTGEGANC